MRESIKKLVRQPLVTVAGILVAGLVVLAALVIYDRFVPQKPARQNGAPQVVVNANTLSGIEHGQNSGSAGLPEYLKIPSIGVNASVESVGLTTSGALAVPKGRSDVAWFNLGPRPGEVGNAVIDGHFGVWQDGTPTVFNNLNKLTAGDKIYVTDNTGITRTFVVRQLQTYRQNQNDSSVFNSTDGGAHLNLITCQGVWNQAKQSYPDRLVVFTDYVSSSSN